MVNLLKHPVNAFRVYNKQEDSSLRIGVTQVVKGLLATCTYLKSST